MTDSAPQFDIQCVGAICVVTPAQSVESLEWQLVEPVADEILETAFKHEPPCVLFDLSKASYFGSVFLTLMLRCWKNIDQRNGTFAVCGATPETEPILKVSHLDHLWKVFPDRTTAVEALNQQF